MDKIPLYTYMAYYQANPIGVTLYNEKEQEMVKYWSKLMKKIQGFSY